MPRNYLLLASLAGLMLVNGCLDGSDFSLRQKPPKAESEPVGTILLEKDAVGNPVRCWTGNGSWMNGTYAHLDAGYGLHLYVSPTTTLVRVPGDAWDMGYALLGISSETCRALGRRTFDQKAGWNAAADNTAKTAKIGAAPSTISK